jgi:hypothetical protein
VIYSKRKVAVFRFGDIDCKSIIRTLFFQASLKILLRKRIEFVSVMGGKHFQRSVFCSSCDAQSFTLIVVFVRNSVPVDLWCGASYQINKPKLSTWKLFLSENLHFISLFKTKLHQFSLCNPKECWIVFWTIFQAEC